MKTLWVALILLFGTSLAFSQPPDPRDSVILESKTVAPGAHPGALNDTASYLYVKVFITNKDSLTYLYLPLEVTSTAGGAYAIAARPRNFFGVVNPLANTLRYNVYSSFSDYDGNSPDIFAVGAGFTFDVPNSIEPPNAARKAVWELKFDTVRTALGTFELDSTRLGGQHVFFSNTVPQDFPVNFLKSAITVTPAPKGDLNLDFALTAADVALILNCTFCTDCPPPPAGMAACDLNCDGRRTAADVVLLLRATFLGMPFPCRIQ